jgi:hypothetical protein
VVPVLRKARHLHRKRDRPKEQLLHRINHARNRSCCNARDKARCICCNDKREAEHYSTNKHNLVRC